ncbi:winged helix-turn-helix transcriptional regulator [Actinomadura verrucosospora]|uniref:HxlR family transcriptional regulator n=1 Tax=Actinomadura verrucosospora TaxID=46165 RepID=A0A7D3VXQ0_ACTVE|nr:helix-turn-helix domain-containing protein [Actinomadura verrucosospora]QKG25880.1 HxlR family transcriptional regulator [Actinomadura verrucosospora]
MDDPEFLADCQTRLGLDLLSGTWTGVVLWTLQDGPLRPRELQDRIGGISQKVLTETLRRLEHNGLVVRRRYAEAPPRVDYELTGPGRGMLEPLSALGRWTERYAADVLDAQERAESAGSVPADAAPAGAKARDGALSGR